MGGDGVDEGLEREPLLAAVVGPEGAERWLFQSCGVDAAAGHAEQVLEAIGLERVAFHVEVQVVRVGGGQALKAQARIRVGGQQRVAQHAVLLPLVLQRAQLPVDVVARVGDTKRMLGACGVAGDHPGAHRLEALRTGDQPRVEGELHQELGLRAARQLGIEHLVVPVAERGRTGYAAQEVGMPDQLAVAKGGLVDDVDARAHRGERCIDLVREARGAPQAEIGLDLDDARMAGLECLARIPRWSQQGSPAWSITGSEPSLAVYH